jgi:hypothetical protein
VHDRAAAHEQAGADDPAGADHRHVALAQTPFEPGLVGMLLQ